MNVVVVVPSFDWVQEDVVEVCLAPLRVLDSVGPLAALSTADVMLQAMAEVVDSGGRYEFHGLRPLSLSETADVAGWLVELTARIRMVVH